MSRYILGVDGGQTAIKFLITDLEGNMFWQKKVVSASSGAVDNTILNIGDRLSSLFGEILSDPMLEKIVYEIAVLGMSGAEQGSPFISEFQSAAKKTIKAKQYKVVHDALTNLMGASAGKPGVVVIAGGGAVAYGITDDGKTWTSSGWGYVVGDEGSGFSVGRQAINAIFRSFDGRDHPTRLSDYIFPELGVTSAGELKYAIFTGRIHFDHIAGLTPIIAQAAMEGDQAARSILVDAGRDIADSAKAVVRALFDSTCAVEIYPTGGLFNEKRIFQPAFNDAILKDFTNAKIHEPIFEPIFGAILLGFKELGYEIDEKLINVLLRSQKNILQM